MVEQAPDSELNVNVTKDEEGVEEGVIEGVIEGVEVKPKVNEDDEEEDTCAICMNALSI